jgi:hypothetical protein
MTRSGRTLCATLAAAVVAALGAAPAQAATASDDTQFSVLAGALAYGVAPNVPSLGTITLNGGSQTTNATMNGWSALDATGSGSGWNVTVQGDSGALKSAVFKEYCTNVLTCGSIGYVTGGETLAANSLTLSSSGASFSALLGTTGTAPTHNCSTACNVDSASAVKVASAAVNAGMGTYQASYTANNLTLSTPSTLKALGTDEVYRVDLTWTLSSGP